VFYNACPAHADEHKYFFTAPSSMKPTQVLTTDAGVRAATSIVVLEGHDFGCAVL
jgi:hypothetical protein